jgi:DMSO/TMAO reductase YedYZ molybdopterin-dependent catalytic subunit
MPPRQDTADLQLPTANGETAPASGVDRRRAWWSGVMAGAAGLATTELVGSLDADGGPSVVTAVGTAFIDQFSGSLKDIAVRIFGTNHKTALIVGIAIITLVLGGLVGRLARKHRALAIGLIVGWAGIGVLAALGDPLAKTGWSITAAVLGAAVASGVLIGLAHLARNVSTTSTTLNTDPRVKAANRRAFLTATGTAGVAAVGTTLVARRLRDTATDDAAKDIAATFLPDAPVAARTALPDGTLDSVDGITPYVVPNGDFYRIDTALIVPRVNVRTWSLKIGGRVDNPFTLTFDEIAAMEQVEMPVTISCVSNEVGGDLVGNAVWRGVPIAKLLERAGVQPGADQLVSRSVDGWTCGFPTSAALDGRTALLAIAMNGEPLPADHGFPARLVVSGIYGYVSATKWISEIELTGWDDFDGYWIPRGWSKEGPVKTQSRIDTPRRKAPAGPLAIGGVAWAPNIGIDRVEVRINEGQWQQCELGAVASTDTWVQWKLDWDAAPGDYELEVRATDKSGFTQPEERTPVAPNGATGYHRRRVTVS